MNRPDIENEIQAKGLTAPRITLDTIEANIDSEHYFTAADGAFGARVIQDGHIDVEAEEYDPLFLLTFCVLILKNGFTVTGESACASPENFNAEIGRKIARNKAVAKVGDFMGYELRSQLSCQAKIEEPTL